MEIKDFYSTKSFKTVRFKPQNWKSSIEHFKLSLSKCPSKPNTHSPYGQPNPTQNSLANSKYTQEADLISWPQINLSQLCWMFNWWLTFYWTQSQTQISPQTQPMILCGLCSEPFPDILLLRFFCWNFYFEIFAFGFLFLYKIVKRQFVKKVNDDEK